MAGSDPPTLGVLSASGQDLGVDSARPGLLAAGDESLRALSAAMDRYADGDDASFSEIYDLLAPRLYGFLLRQTRDPSRAEDVLQQSFLQIHAARGRFIRNAEVLPWAFAIARRLVIDGVRRKRHEVSLAGDSAEDEAEELSVEARADDLVQAKQLSSRLEAALVGLPENQRVAFELVKLEGLSYREAAAVLGATVSAIKVRVHRAGLVLGELLDEG
jgi:RNA polymerase sigma-70 factor, ECF subfamily